MQNVSHQRLANLIFDLPKIPLLSSGCRGRAKARRLVKIISKLLYRENNRFLSIETPKLGYQREKKTKDNWEHGNLFFCREFSVVYTKKKATRFAANSETCPQNEVQ